MATKTPENSFPTTNKPTYGSKMLKKGMTTKILPHMGKNYSYNRWVMGKDNVLEFTSEPVFTNTKHLPIPRSKYLMSAIQHLMDIWEIVRVQKYLFMKGTYFIGSSLYPRKIGRSEQSWTSSGSTGQSRRKSSKWKHSILY